MFRQKYVPSSELVSTPTPRYAGQSMDFRPPAKLAPPDWWQGDRCGECVGGGGLAGGGVFYQWWKNISHDDDVIPVQLVREDTIVGSEVRKFPRCEVNDKILSPLQLRRLAGQLIKAADLLDGS